MSHSHNEPCSMSRRALFSGRRSVTAPPSARPPRADTIMLQTSSLNATTVVPIISGSQTKATCLR